MSWGGPYASKNWIVTSGDNRRRGYDGVKGSICRSYDEMGCDRVCE